MIEEKVFYVEDKEVLNSEILKMAGFKYESAATLGIEGKKGLYLVIKAEDSWFENDEVKTAMKNAEEVAGGLKSEILEKFRELEENAGAGFALFD
ncbi:MAG TPA: hypothetical protein ENN30_02540 [Candidatus Woesearchaeota archaeon]|nr:hypothetical protein [Candidatus Woesearchaeota archaeon]